MFNREKLIEEGREESSLSKLMNTYISPLFICLFIAAILILNFVPSSYYLAKAAYVKATVAPNGPTVNDANLKVEKVFSGELNVPTSMAFLGPNDILVLEKNKGTVDRILNGKLMPEPVLQISNIANEEVEWGLLGIAIDKLVNDSSGPTYVFLYYTEKGSSGERPANHLYRYELSSDGAKLENPTLLMNLPANSPDPQGESNHDGGKIVIGPDHNVYTVIGDVGGHNGQAQNNKDGARLDATSGILRVTEAGQPVSPVPLGDEDPTKVYYAYGVRNSFGIDFDPLTGNLWDTENGANDNDEINLVTPGFNSGWTTVMGFAPTGFEPNQQLVSFDGKGKYHDPQFVWRQTIGPTALKFLNSDKLGKQYENTIFSGDVNTGNLYNFKLSGDRTSLALGGDLSDKVADTRGELQPVIFGQGFGVITDIKVGPGDGYLYVLTYDGSIYRILPN
ncbi:MAG: PQQ-dependent sugar dehydrogenase [Nitrososphaeraceae archaeon]